MRDDVIVVFGGSGFLGRHVVRALAKREKRIRVALRRPHLGGDLRILAPVGQVQLVQANIRYPHSVARALEGATAVVNLVGALNERGPQNFRALHVEGARAVAQAATDAGIKRVVHVSALGAAPKGARYSQSKFEGEEAVRAAAPEAVILRPSIMFGPDDTFFNRFANMAKFAPVLPLFGAKTKFQPVFAGDVARAIGAALDLPEAHGRTFELGGPRTYNFKELLTYTLAEIHRKPALVPLPFFVAQPMGILAEWAFKLVPFMDAPITGDQVSMLRQNNVVSEGADGFAQLGVANLESVEAIVPSYLWRFRPYGQFQTKQTV